jgi:hypothetical protein
MPVIECLVGTSAALGFMLIGGAGYEHLVVDPAWPRRPDLIQPTRGGLLRKRFWIPAHAAFELSLLLGLFLTWNEPARGPLLLALGAQFLQRTWSFAEFIPKASRFEAALPTDILPEAAQRWVKRSLLRLPFSLGAAVGALAAFASVCGAAK